MFREEGRKNSDWQISYDRRVQTFFFARFADILAIFRHKSCVKHQKKGCALIAWLKAASIIIIFFLTLAIIEALGTRDGF